MYLDRLLLSIIFHSSKDRDHTQALQDVADVLNRMLNILVYALVNLSGAVLF